MRKVEVKDKVAELGAELPPVETFWKVGDLTALRRDDRGHYYRSNYERGPRLVLEFGTGRGYPGLRMKPLRLWIAGRGRIVTTNRVA